MHRLYTLKLMIHKVHVHDPRPERNEYESQLKAWLDQKWWRERFVCFVSFWSHVRSPRLDTRQTGTPSTSARYRDGSTRPSSAYSCTGVCTPCPASAASGSGTSGRCRSPRKSSNLWRRTILPTLSTRTSRPCSRQSCLTPTSGANCFKMLEPS